MAGALHVQVWCSPSHAGCAGVTHRGVRSPEFRPGSLGGSNVVFCWVCYGPLLGYSVTVHKTELHSRQEMSITTLTYAATCKNNNYASKLCMLAHVIGPVHLHRRVGDKADLVDPVRRGGPFMSSRCPVLCGNLGADCQEPAKHPRQSPHLSLRRFLAGITTFFAMRRLANPLCDDGLIGPETLFYLFQPVSLGSCGSHVQIIGRNGQVLCQSAAA